MWLPWKQEDFFLAFVICYLFRTHRFTSGPGMQGTAPFKMHGCVLGSTWYARGWSMLWSFTVLLSQNASQVWLALCPVELARRTRWDRVLVQCSPLSFSVSSRRLPPNPDGPLPWTAFPSRLSVRGTTVPGGVPEVPAVP